MDNLKIKDVKELCHKTLNDIRLTSKDENYSESLNFYFDNGFFYEECWNLDETLAALILPRLIHFRDIHSGTPSDFCKFDDEYKVTNEGEANKKWRDCINSMIQAFYLILTRDIVTETEEDRIAIKEGLSNFSRYFMSLWD